VHIDTTHMSVDQVVAEVLAVVREKAKGRAGRQASGHVTA
jgi:hypothetical protein